MSLFLPISSFNSLDLNQLEVVAITQDTALPFYRLIQEQAAQHHSAINHPEQEQVLAQRLYETAIEEQGINAFLIAFKGHPLAAVTYIQCQTEAGEGLYLEDVVTTQAARGRGIGHVAMSALAQVTVRDGYSYLMWECAENNKTAHQFYTNLGASICADRHTWRYYGTARGRYHDQHAGYVCRPMNAEDIAPAAALIRNRNASGLPHLEEWLGGQTAHKNPNSVFLTATTPQGDFAGLAYGYQSYSTFRMVKGLHVNGLLTAQGHEAAVDDILETLSETQQSQNWTGHTDITLSQHHPHVLGFLEGKKYEPLAYGGDRMVVRQFDRVQLECASRLYPLALPPCLSKKRNGFVKSHMRDVA